ncbi:MAG: DUF4382 domain-containing protein [Cyclobacteriaceae bacterium]
MKKIQISSTIFLFAILFGCSDKDGQTTLKIKMIDAPAAEYNQVNVEVMDVLINEDADAEEGEGGWKSVINDESKGKTFDLLSLTNGVEALLVDTEVPSGTISQIRLVLGENNNLVIGGETFDLTTPSAQQSGLKLNVHETLTEGITYTIILDFDAAKSVVKTGNSKYILKPVIRTSTEATSGAIQGSISPAKTQVLITALKQGSAESYNTYTDESGEFLLKGVPAGTYDLIVDFPETEVDGNIEEIEVVTGEVNDIGAHTFAVPL